MIAQLASDKTAAYRASQVLSSPQFNGSAKTVSYSKSAQALVFFLGSAARSAIAMEILNFIGPDGMSVSDAIYSSSWNPKVR